MTPRARPIRHIIEMVAAEFNMTAELLLARRGAEPIPSIRKIAFHVAYMTLEGEQGSYMTIASAFDDRDHTTILLGMRQERHKYANSAWHRQITDRLVARAKAEIFGSSTKHVDCEPDATSATAMNGASSPV